VDNLEQSILQHLKVGKGNAKHQNNLAKDIGIQFNDDNIPNSREIREMRRTITELRHKGYWILSCTQGYYLAESLDEIQETRKYWLKYVKSICVNLRDLKYMQNNFNGQLPFKLD